MLSRRLHLALLTLALSLVPAAGSAEVFAAKNEALAEAFPGADSIRPHTLVLDDAKAAVIERRSQGALESRLATIHTATRDGAVIGYAIIDVHTVRTFPEAFLVVLDPEGRVRDTRILAFYEPPEYMPPAHWLDQFDDRKLDAELRLGGEIHGISGATLSSRALTTGVRRALALYETFLATPAVAAAPQAPPAGHIAAGGQ